MKLRSGNVKSSLERSNVGSTKRRKAPSEEDQVLDMMVKQLMVRRSEREPLRQLFRQSR